MVQWLHLFSNNVSFSFYAWFFWRSYCLMFYRHTAFICVYQCIWKNGYVPICALTAYVAVYKKNGSWKRRWVGCRRLLGVLISLFRFCQEVDAMSNALCITSARCHFVLLIFNLLRRKCCVHETISFSFYRSGVISIFVPWKEHLRHAVLFLFQEKLKVLKIRWLLVGNYDKLDLSIRTSEGCIRVFRYSVCNILESMCCGRPWRSINEKLPELVNESPDKTQP